MATTKETPGFTPRLYTEGTVQADHLAAAKVKDGVLFEVRDLEVYFPIQEGFFKALVSTEKKYVKAVDHISFEVRQGEILALVGESGCGKTTTGRTMLRLEEATGGEILYRGLPVGRFSEKTLRDYRRKAQIIFQDPYNSINPKQTIFDIVAEPLEVNNICASEREKEERVIKAISRGRPAAGDRVPLPLPPRALRRAAAARLHRRRHGARARRDRRRRARRQRSTSRSATTSSS